MKLNRLHVRLLLTLTEQRAHSLDIVDTQEVKAELLLLDQITEKMQNLEERYIKGV